MKNQKGENKNMNLYVDVHAGRDGNGTEKMPFRRINEAAKVAKPGDTSWFLSKSTFTSFTSSDTEYVLITPVLLVQQIGRAHV